jgi:hypothetical protein
VRLLWQFGPIDTLVRPLRLRLGLLPHLTAWAKMFKIPYRGVPVGTIKRHVTGRGNADKEAVIAAVRALGFDPADDNEADALALLHWALGSGGRR